MEYGVIGFLFFSICFFVAAAYVERKTYDNGWVITGLTVSTILQTISLFLFLSSMNAEAVIKVTLLRSFSTCIFISSFIILSLSIVNGKRFFRSRKEKNEETSPKD